MSSFKVVVYSDDASVRESVRKALGRRLSLELPENEVIEFATADALRLFIDEKKIGKKSSVDLFILDGEATPEGGMGLARQLKDEIFNCPPTVVIVAREQDAWLAGWSRADGVITHPIDPFTLAKNVLSVVAPLTAKK
jgi:DNA-binding response OmpR family regulator